MFSSKIKRILLRFFFPNYYKLKIAFYRFLLGDEALSYVLYDSLFPAIVLKIGGATIGSRTRINRWLTIHESRGSFKNLIIGDNVHIGKHVFIDIWEKVIIKDRVGIGFFSKIITHRFYGHSRLSKLYTPYVKPVVIGEDTTICNSSILLPGTRLGTECNVLPNSVVMGQYGDNVTLVGNPARMTVGLKNRPD